MLSKKIRVGIADLIGALRRACTVPGPRTGTGIRKRVLLDVVSPIGIERNSVFVKLREEQIPRTAWRGCRRGAAMRDHEDDPSRSPSLPLH